MGKTVVFLTSGKSAPPIEDQKALCLAPGDEVILAGDVRFTDLMRATARSSGRLQAGDHLKFYDLNSLILATGSLVRLLTKLLRAGVTIEICSERLIIRPEQGDAACRLLALLDKQHRAVHAARTQGSAGKAGRKQLLKDEQWPAIRALLADHGHSLGQVAAQYGVGRTTLFNFSKRMQALESAQQAIDG